MGSDFAVFPGGKGANQAYAAAKLGARVSMVGQVGNDLHARWLKSGLASQGVDVSQVQTDPEVASGSAVILIDGTAENEIVIAPGSNGTFGPKHLLKARDTVGSAAFVLLQLEIPLPTVGEAARIAKAAGGRVILDPAPAQKIPDDLLSLVDYITPNEGELAALVGGSGVTRADSSRKARELLRRGAKAVIVKLGAAGALLVTRAKEHLWPAFEVPAVDTTAAGDAFNAAFAVALSEGQEELEAGRFASAAASCAVTRRGAQAGMPSLEEVEALLRRES